MKNQLTELQMFFLFPSFNEKTEDKRLREREKAAKIFVRDSRVASL